MDRYSSSGTLTIEVIIGAFGHLTILGHVC